MNQSAKKVFEKHNDLVTKQTCESASNKSEAYIKEQQAIEEDGGARNDEKNYNQRNSPGKKLLENK
jgi:hypothetical protein